MKKIETNCVQGTYEPKVGEPRVAPIVQSTTFYYETLEQMADLFDLKSDGYFYSRLANPTCSVLEGKINLLEGGSGAIACASGMSAILLAVLNVCFSGDNIVCSKSVYGGTYNLFSVTLKKYGITTRFVDCDASDEEIEKYIDDKTKIIYAETVSNPNIIVLDFDKFARISKKYGILFYVDNTLSTPILCRPFEYGANVVLHSSSKYLDGHAVALGGIIVDGGNFNFKDNVRYPEFNNPDDSYHGLIYANLEKQAFIVKARVQMMRDFGAIMSPENAFLTNLGMETLHLRMERHIENVRKIAQFLYNDSRVSWVKHPSLESDLYFERSKKYLKNGSTAMMAFGLKGDLEITKKFISNLKLIANVTHVADVRSCILNPASTTHRQMSKKDLEESGIPYNLIRLSVGIENADDIIEDLKNSLDKL